MSRPISTNARPELMASNDQRFKGVRCDLAEDVEHIPFALFTRHGADIAGFGTIVRAFEIRMAYVNIPCLAPNGTGEKRIHLRRDMPAPDALRPQDMEDPFGGEMNREGGDNPIRTFG